MALNLYQRYVESLQADVTGIQKREAQVATENSQLASQPEATLSGRRLKPITSDVYHKYKQLRKLVSNGDITEFVDLR